MSTAPPALSNLARRLIALELARGESSPAGGAGRVCDRLRVPLARLAGVAGFRSLLSRALVLAKAGNPSLHLVVVQEDGTLEGFAEHGADGDAIVTHLLALLVTFIGEPLTRQLVMGAWPDAGETDGRVGGHV